jgi:hypothetical protein
MMNWRDVETCIRGLVQGITGYSADRKEKSKDNPAMPVSVSASIRTGHFRIARQVQEDEGSTNNSIIDNFFFQLHGLSPRANYTGRTTAACRRSDCQLLRIEGATWSA